ncbi:MAG TPA: polysaccharide deacetylase family protein [Rhizomicrobium sp.]|jgi:peptidoglycan/xylan/chitin deacetylase (PgdA/CDA1 family)
MMRNIIRAGLALAFALIASPGWAHGLGFMEVAFLESHNIFNSGLKGTHTVALTFDDGPNANTPAVLDVLKALNVKATFFIVGNMAETHPDILARIAAEGHLLANHTATHVRLGRLYADHPELLLSQVGDVDAEITPLQPRDTAYFFRAPYGAWRPQLAETLNADAVLRKYVGPVYWDEGGQVRLTDDNYILSSSDWGCWHRRWSPELCSRGYIREIWRNDGGIVLMHCIHSQSAALVAAVVPALKAEGFKIVRLDQVPEFRRYASPAVATVPELRAQLRS